jgi:hypothetical protein
VKAGPKDRVTFQISLMFRKESTTDLLDPRCFRWASTLGKIYSISCVGQAHICLWCPYPWEAGLLKGALYTKVANAFGDYMGGPICHDFTS